MGMYDDFVYDCVYCGKETSSQTKLGDCSMSNLKIGSEFCRDGKIKMKNACEHCGEFNTVVVRDGIIVEFIKGEEAVFEEEYWGSFNKIENVIEEYIS